MIADTDAIAQKVKGVGFAELPAVDQANITGYIAAIEAKLQLPPYNFRLSSDVVTELLPASGGHQIDSPELVDYETSESGHAIPIDTRPASSVLALRYRPVLATSLQVWEHYDAKGGQDADAFPASSLLELGVDYYLDESPPGVSTSGRLHRIGSGWSTVPRSIKVEYIGGPLAQQTADLGVEFLTVLRSCVELAAAENYLFWKQQQQALSEDNPGRVLASETIGKHSESFTAVGGSSASGVGFGQSGVTLPEHLAEGLAPFINTRSLLGF